MKLCEPVGCWPCDVQVFQQEVSSRRELVVSLQDDNGLDPGIRAQLLQLSNIWERVQELGDVRENKLSEALELVSDVVHSVVWALLVYSSVSAKRCATPGSRSIDWWYVNGDTQFQSMQRVLACSKKWVMIAGRFSPVK